MAGLQSLKVPRTDNDREILMWRNGLKQLIDQLGSVEFGSTYINGNIFTLDFDDTGGNVDVVFGKTVNEHLRHTGAQFQFSDPLRINTDITIDTGSITSASGAITFGNEDLSTSGTLTLSGYTQNSVLFVGAAGLMEEDTTNLVWDNGNLTLDVKNFEGLQIVTAKVAEAAGLSKGDAVYISGATGDKPQVMLADNTLHSNAHALGVAAGTAAVNQNIDIAIWGELTDVNTSGFDAAGDRMHLGAAGAMTTGIPVSGAHIHMGFVTKKDAANGIMFVAPEVYTHDIRGTSDVDVKLATGDDAAVFKIIFEDYSANDLGFIQGNGLFEWNCTNKSTADFNIKGQTDNDLFYVDVSDDSIGIGTSSISAGDKVLISSVESAEDVRQRGLNIVAESNVTSGSNNKGIFALNAQAVFDSTQDNTHTSGIVAGRYISQVTMETLAVVDIAQVTGISGQVSVESGGAGATPTIANASSILSNAIRSIEANGTIVDANNFYAVAHTTAGGGLITNAYGAYFEEQTVGGTINNEIFLAGGGGIFFRDNDTEICSDTSDEIQVILGGAELAEFAGNGFNVKQKGMMTAIGGYAIKLTNTTGAATVQGQTVKADPATNDAVILTAADDNECIGVFLDAGIADDAEAWVVVAGIADVAMGDNEAATRGNWVETNSTEAGYADATAASPAAAPQHFNEIGHCIESVAAGGGGTHILARCVLHFN